MEANNRPQDTSGQAKDTKHESTPSGEEQETRRLALLNPAFMRGQEYDSFRMYGETYVSAPDSYARPEIPAAALEGMVAELLKGNPAEVAHSDTDETVPSSGG
jgi:hypothetical protein